MTITWEYLADCDRMVRDHYFYDNGIPARCYPNPYKGRDCSTFVAFALIAAGVDVEPCINSFGLARWCYNQPRPSWFTQRFGPGMGTFITHSQALNIVCLGFEGTEFGLGPLSGGRGHVETSLGNGGGSVGAHSHATGVGYALLDTHNLSSWAVPPAFLVDMAPAPIDWNALRILFQWKTRVEAKTLKYGMRGEDVHILNDLLMHKGYLVASGDRYGDRTWIAVNQFKQDHGWPRHTPSITGAWFGGAAADVILR